MTDIEERAKRIKAAILANGGYDYVSESTGINLRTLKRIAAGQTDPRFSDIISISKVTKTSVYHFANGDTHRKFANLGEQLFNLPEMLTNAFLSQQEQTERTIDLRLSAIEKKLSKLSFKEQIDIKEELKNTTEYFREEANKETEGLRNLTGFLSDIRDVAENDPATRAMGQQLYDHLEEPNKKKSK